jgi:ferredoxin
MTRMVPEMSGLQVHVDRDKCESYGVCVAASPTVFNLNDEDELEVMVTSPEDSLVPELNDAVSRCPKRAIELRPA